MSTLPAGLCTKASNHKPVTTRLVRRHLWMSPGGFSMSRRDSDSEKVPAALYDRLTDTPTYAARMYKVQTRAGDSVGPASVPVGVALDVTGVDAGVGVSFVGVEAGVGAVVVGVGPGAGVSDASVGTGVVVASGFCELAGNAVVAAPSLGVSVETACGVSVGSAAGVTGLSADIAASVGAGTVSTVSLGLGVGAWPPQASRAARITRAAHGDIFNIWSFHSYQPGGIANSGVMNVPTPFLAVHPASVGSAGFPLGGHDQ